MFSLLTSVLKDQWKCKIAQFLFSPRFRANNYISEMKNLQFFLNLSLFTASMCWQQQIRKCCPETEFLDQYYDCRHTLGKFQFQTFFTFIIVKLCWTFFIFPLDFNEKVNILNLFQDDFIKTKYIRLWSATKSVGCKKSKNMTFSF